MRVAIGIILTFAAAVAVAQNTPQAAPGKPLFEIITHFIDDVGTNENDVLIRVFQDGVAEYSRRGKPELHRGRLAKGTIARLGAILNQRSTQRLKRSYPAWQSYGYSAMDYHITFLSGSVTYTTESANVFPVGKGKRDEYPTPLLQLLCAAFDLRAAVDAEFGRSFHDARNDCEEFPRFVKPTKQ
jgi:hypothetical protein